MKDHEILLLKYIARAAVYLGCVHAIQKQSINISPELKSVYNIKKTIEHDYWEFCNNLTQTVNICVNILENMGIKEGIEYEHLLALFYGSKDKWYTKGYYI